MTLYQAAKALGHDLKLKFAACVALVIAADFLFYMENPGWTVGLFALLLLSTALSANIEVLKKPTAKLIGFGALGLTFSLAYDPTVFAAEIFIATMVWLALLARGQEKMNLGFFFQKALTHHLFGARQFIIDTHSIIRKIRRSKNVGCVRPNFKMYILPSVLSVVFILLFTSANPILGRIVGRIDLAHLLDWLSFYRIVFWLGFASVCWAFIRPRFRGNYIKLSHGTEAQDLMHFFSSLLSRQSVLGSLIAFNVIFLVQNALDVTFLWSGAKLPEGMSYAAYAHQGAYPLIITSLLAGAYVLIAFRPGSYAGKALLLRRLVSLWVGQNVFLVASSILRLMGYIGEYSLTYMRITALIWMVLVAVGLVLILTRIYLNRSNSWLIKCNIVALYLTLYICCFINFSSLIAFYNVQHAHEITGTGVYLDCEYLKENVGFEAIPAMIWFENNSTVHKHCIDLWMDENSITVASSEKLKLIESLHDWHSWTYRKQQLLTLINGLKAEPNVTVIKLGAPNDK